MRCPQCRFENRQGIRFCEECGVKLDLTCPACSAAVPPDRKFWGGCGQPLAGVAIPSPAAAAKFGSPEAYTPKHLAEKILTSVPAAPAGLRRARLTA